MNFEDKEFEKLVKKARRERLLKSTFSSILAIIILLGLILSGYWFYWNLGPFQGNKVAGVPDGQIRAFQNKETETLSTLLMQNFESYGLNIEAKELIIYADYYEKDKRIRHDIMAGSQQEETQMLSTILSWGVIETANAPTEVRIQFANAGVLASGGFTFEGYGTTENPFNNAASRSHLLKDGPLKLNKRYVLQYWIDDGEVGYSDTNVIFDKEYLREWDRTLIMYMEIK
ncbi:hypothetical protein IGI37_003174 [Enterococcus sp. AZ194]|uniref:hypothetical protein n=1 Tax=Enterococcus sp. AZ194 TaxID=2774629 RepID=UPI003F1FD42D